MDSKQLILRLRNGERRLAYAAVKSINNTLRKVQDVQRGRLHREFVVRKKQFMERQIAIIKPWANVRQGRPYGEVSIGDRPRLLLSKFQFGGLRRPVKGKRVAVPVTGGEARPSFGKPVAPEYRFRALRLKRARRGRGRARGGIRPSTKERWVGEQDTFILLSTPSQPYGGVFRRTGPGKDDIEPVYVFKPPMALRARLRWLRTTRRVINTWFKEYMEREAAQAVAHARGRLA